MHADRGAMHGPTVIFGALHQEVARAPQLPGKLPDDLNWREAVAKLVDQLGGLPSCPVGAVKRIEQIADDLLSHDGGGIVAAAAADISSKRRDLCVGPQRGAARGVERRGELLLMIGANLIGAWHERGQQLPHDFEPAADATDDQTIDQRSAQNEIAIDAERIVERADFGRIGDQHHVDNSWHADMPRHDISSLIWATDKSYSVR